jgi:hypothetical protein
VIPFNDRFPLDHLINKLCTIKYKTSLKNDDIKLSTEKVYFISDFTSIFEDMTELKIL